ncbi:aliphatic sulfonate ABC transporter substrate-binding protein [Rhizorhabdus argentea]|uniref:aliphatic sulfonate ABC transporter substrate-binding protein n=1 Tax=Rhizorhabdus argentea TaxID=1387174 RepID=UPI0030EDF85E
MSGDLLSGSLPLSRRRLLAAAGATLLLAACTRDESAGVVIGYQRGGILYLAKSRGDFERRLAARGVAPVKWVEFASGPPLVEAMRSGAIDIGFTGDTPLAYAQASGSPIVYVAAQVVPDTTGGLIVRRDSPIRDVAGLRGRRLTFTKGSASELSAVIALRAAGLSITDVEPVYLTPADSMAAFVSGKVDAWLTWEPYLSLSDARIGIRSIPIDRGGLKSIAYYLAGSSFADRRPDVVTHVLDELRVEADWARAHIPETVEIAAQATGLPLAIQQKVYDRYGSAIFAVDRLSPEIIANQQRVVDLLRTAGVVDHPIDARAAAWTRWQPA